MSREMTELQVVAVGDDETNKATYLYAWRDGRSVSSYSYQPVAFDNYTIERKIGNRDYTFAIRDETGKMRNSVMITTMVLLNETLSSRLLIVTILTTKRRTF